VGGGVVRGGGTGWRASRADQRKEKRGADEREGSGPAGSYRRQGSPVISHRPADSDPIWTEELACDASESGKCVSFFSLRCQKRSAKPKAAISGVAIRYNGKKLNLP
jgi:hypothetical protein